MSWAKDAIRAVKKLHLAHPFFQDALMNAFALLSALEDGEVILIVGPSRIGKTRLAYALARLFLGEHPNIPEGHKPVLYIIAKNNAAGAAFSTKAFKRRALRALQHPFFSSEDVNSNNGAEFLRRIQLFTEDTMDDAFTQSLKHRHTKLVITDEAGHIKYLNSKSGGSQKVLDSWKCAAQESKYILVLIGDYTLPSIVRASPHLLGRSSTVHLPRYRWEYEDERIEFHKILVAYSKVIPLSPNVTSLREWDALLHKETLGCIGHLSSLLRRALARARATKAPYLTREHIELAARSKKDTETLRVQIELGETELTRPKLETSVGLEANSNTSNAKPEKPRKKGRGFRSNPRRHPVGTAEEMT